MAVSLSQRSAFLMAPYRHLVLIACLIGVGWIGYVIWQLAGVYYDQPLPPERISAKQLRVNESQRQAVLKSITDSASVPAVSVKNIPPFH